MTPWRWMRTGAVAAMAASMALLGGCASLGVGFTVPLGRAAGVGVSVGSDGQVGFGLGVGRGNVQVGVGGTTRLDDRVDGPPRKVHPGAPQWSE